MVTKQVWLALAVMIFTDRSDAGQKLAKNILKYEDEDVVVLALPRGGVPVGLEIANFLSAPLEVLVIRKLGAPNNPEFGIGAIAPEGVLVLDQRVIDHMGLTLDEMEAIESRERLELKRRVKLYDGPVTAEGQPKLPEVNQKTVVLVDDGVATGVSMRAAIKAVLSKTPKKLIVAIPVCFQDAVFSLTAQVRPHRDAVISLLMPYDFGSVGSWYLNFSQVTDKEVVKLLHQTRRI